MLEVVMMMVVVEHSNCSRNSNGCPVAGVGVVAKAPEQQEQEQQQ